jgi:hypothetical protein
MLNDVKHSEDRKPQMTRATTTPVRITPEAREALSQLSYTLTGRVLRRVDLSSALIAACATAQAHIDQTMTALPKGADDDSDD